MSEKEVRRWMKHDQASRDEMLGIYWEATEKGTRHAMLTEGMRIAHIRFLRDQLLECMKKGEHLYVEKGTPKQGSKPIV
jgi:hypothetical protein